MHKVSLFLLYFHLLWIQIIILNVLCPPYQSPFYSNFHSKYVDLYLCDYMYMYVS